MTRLFSFLLTLLLAGVFAGRLSAAPMPVIFDTDMGNDVDDALALGMLHSLETRGVCRLIAVTLTIDDPKAAPFIDAINTFYGRGNIPIGAVRKGVKLGPGPFLKLVDARDEGQPRYPHTLKSGDDALEAVALLRETLSAQPDGTAVIVQVGFSTNLARLLDSPPDRHSPLSGRELVKRKVRLLSLMAGAFTPIGNDKRYREFNVIHDISAAKKLASEWPTPTVWSGFEIGIAAPFPVWSAERDFDYVPHHPLKEAYYLYNPPPHERPTWDLTSVLYAVYPDRNYFGLSDEGTVTVEDDGFTRFTARPGGNHRYLKMDAMQAARVREVLAQLSTQPPR